MTKEDRISYAEIYFVIKNMGSKYINALPKALWQFICDTYDKDYVVNYDKTKSLKDNNFSDYTYDILNLLNLNYWCKSIESKKMLLANLKGGSFKLVEHFGKELPLNDSEIKEEKAHEENEAQINTNIEISKNYNEYEEDKEKRDIQNMQNKQEIKKDKKTSFFQNIKRAIKYLFVNEDLINQYNLDNEFKINDLNKKYISKEK